jgi:hypothetical protein
MAFLLSSGGPAAKCCFDIVETLENRQADFQGGQSPPTHFMGCVLAMKSTAGRFAAPAAHLRRRIQKKWFTSFESR